MCANTCSTVDTGAGTSNPTGLRLQDTTATLVAVAQAARRRRREEGLGLVRDRPDAGVFNTAASAGMVSPRAARRETWGAVMERLAAAPDEAVDSAV